MTDNNLDLEKIYEQTQVAVKYLLQKKQLTAKQILVVGTSTSEVAGERIGSSGSINIAAKIFCAIQAIREQYEFQLAFQCCEHLNRALVVERKLLDIHNCNEVSARPVVIAGGAMATYAYQYLDDPILVESIQADAGIDIGETIIGMHLKPVVVPVRYPEPFIGQARVLLAITRPKLIGGERAVYNNSNESKGDI